MTAAFPPVKLSGVTFVALISTSGTSWNQLPLLPGLRPSLPNSAASRARVFSSPGVPGARPSNSSDESCFVTRLKVSIGTVCAASGVARAKRDRDRARRRMTGSWGKRMRRVMTACAAGVQYNPFNSGRSGIASSDITERLK